MTWKQFHSSHTNPQKCHFGGQYVDYVLNVWHLKFNIATYLKTGLDWLLLPISLTSRRIWNTQSLQDGWDWIKAIATFLMLSCPRVSCSLNGYQSLGTKPSLLLRHLILVFNLWGTYHFNQVPAFYQIRKISGACALHMTHTGSIVALFRSNHTSHTGPPITHL